MDKVCKLFLFRLCLLELTPCHEVEGSHAEEEQNVYWNVDSEDNL